MVDEPKTPESEADEAPEETDEAGDDQTPDPDHPGRPRAKDELDPELMKLPKRRTKIGWLLAASVMAFCAYWMITLRDDLAYSRAGGDPNDVAISELLEASSESFVATEVIPDRMQAARVWKGTDLGVHAAPALGSGGRVWLVTSGSAFSGEPAYGNRYAGRVKRLGDLPFYDHLRRYFAESKAPLEPVDVLALAEAKAGGALRSSHGDVIAAAADSAVELTWRPGGRVWIIASPEVDGPTDSMTWRAALERQAGLTIRGEIERKVPTRVPTWTFEVAAPNGLDAVVARLADAKLSAARVAPVEETVTGTWSQLEVSPGELSFGKTPYPTSEVVRVSVANRIEPKSDAVVLIAGEEPGDFWYILPLYALLLLLMLLFGWTLVRALRGSLPPTPAKV